VQSNRFRPLIRQKIIDSLAVPAPALTRRDVWLPTVAGKAVAIIGMRRTGKTSLMWQVLSDRLARATPREGLLYFSFEDERLADMGMADLDLLVEEYYRLHPEWRDGRHRATLFLDEIQLVPGWEAFARRLLDSENVELFVSGSSARLLSREVASSMRGRAMEAVVLPFSLREGLRHAGLEPAQAASRLTKAARSRLDKALHAWLVGGGFPEAQGLDARHRAALLGGYVDTVLLRDVIERHAVSQPIVLRWMVRQLLASAGGTFSIHKFHSDLKAQNIAVSKETLHSYLAHLQDAFLIFTVAVATESEQRRRVNPRKAYPIDMGLITVFDRSQRANLGHMLETAAALELIRRGAELAYVHTPSGYEVDFLARHPDGREQLIQVCANLDDAQTRARELRALQDAATLYPRAERLLVVLDGPAVMETPAGVTWMNAAEWLLDA